MSRDLLLFGLLLAGAYLLGALPFGLIAGKLRGVDLRQGGSGNIGATNAWRLLGPRVGLSVFILDLLKGYIVVVVAAALAERHGPLAVAADPGLQSLVALVAGAAAILGHMFPVYLSFRGGKGVATGLGVLTAVHTPTALCALGVWLLVLSGWRYVSLASIAAAAAYPLLMVALLPLSGRSLREHSWTWLGVVVLCALVVLKHHANFARIRAGREPKIGMPRAETPAAASPPHAP